MLIKTASIQQQLSHKVVLFTGVVLLVIALLSDFTVTRWLENQYDESLIVKASLLVTLTKDMPDGIDFDFADEFMPEFERKNNPEYFQLWTHDKNVFERSHSLKESNLEYLGIKTPGQILKDIKLLDGREGRMIQVVFLPQIPEEKDRTTEKLASQTLMTLAIAKERDTLNQLIFLVHLTLAFGTVIVLLIINFVVSHTVKAGLKPLNNMKDQIMLLDADNLTSRLKITLPPSELEDVIKQFNALLQRLETSFTREQRFTSDVAHELRTPIAEIRNMAEVALKWPEDTKLSKGFYQDVLASSLQMQQLVVNLLSLARSENGLIELEPKEFNLNAFIQDAWQHVSETASDKSIRLECHVPESLNIMTSYAEFMLILNNLLANAVDYSPLNATITVSVQTINNNLRLSISNPTENLEHADIEHIFERLWRKNKSRTVSLHSGLGLSLVKSHAELLNLRSSATLQEDMTFVFNLDNIALVQ